MGPRVLYSLLDTRCNPRAFPGPRAVQVIASPRRGALRPMVIQQEQVADTRRVGEARDRRNRHGHSQEWTSEAGAEGSSRGQRCGAGTSFERVKRTVQAGSKNCKGPKKPKAAKDATPPPEPSHFSSFWGLAMEVDLYARAEEDAGEGEDEDEDDAVPALPYATQALANLGIEMDLDLGYESLLVAQQARERHAPDQDVVMSTLTKARPVPVAAADKSKPKTQPKPE